MCLTLEKLMFTTMFFAWSDLLLWAFSSRLEMQSPFVDLCHLLGRSVLLPTFKFKFYVHHLFVCCRLVDLLYSPRCFFIYCLKWNDRRSATTSNHNALVVVERFQQLKLAASDFTNGHCTPCIQQQLCWAVILGCCGSDG